MRVVNAIMVATFAVFGAAAQAQDGALARCGASAGQSYFFRDDLWNPDGPSWDADGISNGHIILVRLGQEWDILFGDAIGSSGYRQDGATVIPLTASESLFVVGAFHSNYSDIYVFNLVEREVVWTSSKIGPLAPKVAIYRAACE